MERLSVFSLLVRKQNFGIILVFAGIMTITLPRKVNSGNSTLDMVVTLTPVMLVISGILAIFLEMQRKDLKVYNASATLESDINQAISQLSKNYDILRKQTIHGFTISGIFMSLGLIIILVGITGEFFKLEGNTKIIATASGIAVEFISGTALLLYRLNFKRLNETSDKLLSTWKLLTAFEKAGQLTPERKDEVHIDLIKKLT